MSFETLDRCYILIHIYQIFFGAARNNLSLATNMYYTSILLFGHHDISVRLSEQMYQWMWQWRNQMSYDLSNINR